MSKVSLTIDGINITAPQGSTILEAAALAGIRIPTLCHLKDQNVKANCRICVVQVKGMVLLQPACATKAAEGMTVWTDTDAIRESRKTSLELILSSHSWDCHHCLRIGNYGVEELDKELCSFCFFCDCVKDGDCELQALAEEYDVRQLPFDWCGESLPLDDSTGSVVRNPNKCVKCRRCIEVCTNEQTVNALGVEHRGSRLQVVPALGNSLADSPCVKCGKCIDVCPTGAIYAKEQIDEMLYTVRLEKEKRTVAQISPGIRGELARLLDMDERDLDLKQLATGLRKIGVETVVSEEYAASAASAEAVEKLSEALKQMPGTVILSNSAPAIELIRKEFTDLDNALLTYPSAEQKFGQLVKGEWAKHAAAEAENVCAITLSTDVSCKAEALQPDMHIDGVPSVDFVLTPREIARMLNKTAVDLRQLPQGEYDLLGEARVPSIESCGTLLENPGGAEGVTELELQLDGKTVRAAVVCGLGGVRRMMEEIQSGVSPYQVVRVCS